MYLEEEHSRERSSRCQVSEPLSHVQETSARPRWLQWSAERGGEEAIWSGVGPSFTGTGR